MQEKIMTSPFFSIVGKGYMHLWECTLWGACVHVCVRALCMDISWLMWGGGVGVGGIESIREIRRENLQGLLKMIQLQCHGTCLLLREYFFNALSACALSGSCLLCEHKHCDVRDPVHHQTSERTLHFQGILKVIQLQCHGTCSSLKNCSWQRSTSLWPVCLCFEWKLLVVWVRG